MYVFKPLKVLYPHFIQPISRNDITIGFDEIVDAVELM